jgi:hypothetical protein
MMNNEPVQCKHEIAHDGHELVHAEHEDERGHEHEHIHVFTVTGQAMKPHCACWRRVHDR